MKRLLASTALALLLATSAVEADTAVVYTVVEGDTLQTIAGQYDVTVEDIMISNGLETEEIEVGTVVYIPPPHARGYFDAASDTYTIAPGDDLFSIAERFGTTVAALEQANELKSNEIVAGHTLRIP